jgi:hypothetical protein
VSKLFAEFLSHESLVRVGCFVSVLAAMSVWELVSPRRKLSVSKSPRWASNLGLVALNAAVTRLVVPITAVAFAETARVRGWGLLNSVDWPM